MKKRFEYATYDIKKSYYEDSTEINTDVLKQDLDTLGKDGWEVVSVIETNKTHRDTNEDILLLKKEIIGNV